MNHTTNPQDACRSTQHCAYHGWCRRCDPSFAETMSRVNVAIQHTDGDESHWGPLYEAVGKALRAAVSPSVVVSADRATLRDRIADTVMPFLLNFSDEESARINAAEVADALLSVLPAPAPVCICGHSKQQHFEDACITEITGCNCGDYLEPQDAAEVIDRWRQAALQARAADRATLLRAAEAPADWIDGHPQLEAIAAAVRERCEHHDSGLIIDDPRNIAVAALAALLPAPADGPSRVAAEEQPAETHSCSNCEGIDPDTCWTNPNRPPEQCPAAEFVDYGLQCQKPVGHELHTFEERPTTDERPAVAGQPDHLPRRGDTIDTWLKTQRDEHRDDDRGQWTVLDQLLYLYRLHADTNTPLAEQPDTQTREAFVPPAHYRGRDGTAYCVHATPIGPDSCRHCRELAE